MTTMAIKRVNTLPGSLDPSTMYICKNAIDVNYVDLFFTDTAGTEAKKVMSIGDIDEPIEPFLLMGV